MSTDQFQMRDPRTQYPQPESDHQSFSAPGTTDQMDPKPDHGETSYVGTGRLKGRRALVTGADSGIGRAAAIAFAREGADVAISYLPAEKRDADAVIALIRKEGRTVVDLPGDISVEENARKLVRDAVAGLGGLDIVCNVAGMQTAQKSLADITTDQLEATFRTNVYAMFWICQEALPHLPPGATIINTTSIQGYQPSPMLLDYAASKAAIVSFTHSLAKSVAEKGIRVNAVAPGPFWTPLQPSGGQPPEKIPTLGQQVPLGRPGQPAECAPIYVLLAGQESSFVTGEVYGVTGGNHLP